MPHKDFYRNGQKLVSVTELQRIIAKPFLDTWKESLCVSGQVCGFDAARHVAEEASEMGNKTHEYVEMWLKGFPVEPNEWGCRIVDKIVEMGISKCLIDPEQSIVDEESGLAGSPDFIGTCASEGIFIGDLKIKNSLDTLTGLQGAGYRYLIRRKFDVDINKMLILWAQKKSVKQTIKAVVIPLDPWVKPFEALVELWNTINQKRKVTLLG